MLSLGQLYTDDINDDANNGDNANDNDDANNDDNNNAKNNDNDTWRTNHDYIGLLACMRNEPKGLESQRPKNVSIE